MKKISILIMSLLAIGFVASCSDSDNAGDGQRVFEDQNLPQVVSVTPIADAADIDTFSNVEITYNEPIFRTPNTTIRLYTDDSTYTYVDSGVVAVGNKLIIPIHAKGNMSYKVEVLKPSVRDSSYNFAKDYSLSFSTRLYNNFVDSLFDIAPEPVNENATEQTKKIYEYLVSQFGKKTLSGAMANVNHNTLYADSIYLMSGKYPAINTFDFVHFIYSAPLNPTNWINYTDNSIEEDWSNNGGIVSYMWHWMVPNSSTYEGAYSTYAFYCNGAGSVNTTFNTKFCNLPSKWEYKHLNKDMDIICDYLLALQNKGIAVIWRPLHEAAGNVPNGGKAWFWWGNGGSNVYTKLWQRMYTYFKNKGVNNLIWVWTSCGNDDEWYPGNDYVDAVAYDYYEDTPAKYHNSNAEMFEKLRVLTGGKKLITMAECGAVPSYDNMLNDGAVWSWFMPWYGNYTTGGVYNTSDFFNKQMNSEYVITRDELPSFK